MRRVARLKPRWWLTQPAHHLSTRTVPRNVVTLVPRLLVLPTRRNDEHRQAIIDALAVRYRIRVSDNPKKVEIDFPKRLSHRAAKDDVMAELDRLEPTWRRFFVLYPTEDSLRRRGE